MCILIFIGTNGETYLNTASLVSCVQNFPKSRGPVAGILKGFAGLGGAILKDNLYILLLYFPKSLPHFISSPTYFFFGSFRTSHCEHYPTVTE
ncbi:hypothetical protein ABFS83_02G087700 [Erythranthe nasuta]